MTRTRLLLLGILAVYMLLGGLFATRTPDWQAPDEPAHYNYVAQVANGTLIPVIDMGDWDNDYLEQLKASGFAAENLDNLAAVQYEDHQPPLYYWLATPVYLISNGSLVAVRLYSVLLGAITVLLTFAIVQAVFPERPYLALATTALVAFIPQHVAILASVNNDALAGVWIALTLWLTIRYLKQDPIPLWWLGLAIGLITITKTTGYFMAGVVILAVVMRWYQGRQTGAIHHAPTNNLIRNLITFASVPAIFALLYWGRNIATYGFPDFLGLKQHDAIVIGQLRTADSIAAKGFSTYLSEGLQTTFHSFWGQFGWMAAPMHGAIPQIYMLIAALILIAAGGLLLYIFRPNLRDTVRGTIWITLGMVLLLAMLQFVYYNLTFVQFQGRYIFTGIIPFALGLTLGLDTWRKLISKRAEWLPLLIVSLFAVLDFYLIWRVIPGALG